MIAAGILLSCDQDPTPAVDDPQATEAAVPVDRRAQRYCEIISTDPVKPKGATKIAFASDRDGDFEIFTMNPDGSDVRQVTSNRVDDLRPDWSPDARQIAFVRLDDQGHRRSIVISSADGSREEEWRPDGKRWDGPRRDFDFPAWSPNGKWITFESHPSLTSGPGYLYVARVNGSWVGVLGGHDELVYDSESSWRSDGKELVYHSYGVHDEQIRSLKFCPYRDRLLFQAGGNTLLGDVVAHPRGEPILYTSRYGGTPNDRFSQLILRSRDGRRKQSLTPRGGKVQGISWSPDGRHIATAIFYRGSFDVMTMRGDGARREQLTDGSYNDIDPDWSN